MRIAKTNNRTPDNTSNNKTRMAPTIRLSADILFRQIRTQPNGVPGAWRGNDNDDNDNDNDNDNDRVMTVNLTRQTAMWHTAGTTRVTMRPIRCNCMHQSANY